MKWVARLSLVTLAMMAFTVNAGSNSCTRQCSQGAQIVFRACKATGGSSASCHALADSWYDACASGCTP